MKINCGELIDALSKGGDATYDKLTDLISCIKQIQEDWKDKNFIEVQVFSHDGDITDSICAEFPEYDMWWEGDPGYCGKNVVLVPGDEWNDDVKAKLAKFDSEAGHHIEKAVEWKLKDDVKLPYDLKFDIEGYKREVQNKTGKEPEVIQLSNSMFHQYPWTQYSGNRSTYFDEVEVVAREYDIELDVIDRRSWRHDDIEFRKKTIEL